jgi:hypothetical protein
MVGIRTFVDEGLGHSSYLVDLGDGTAAIVDPPRFPTPHLAARSSTSASGSSSRRATSPGRSTSNSARWPRPRCRTVR